MKVTLSTDRTIATVDGFEFKVGENIEYKEAGSNRIGMGRITELKHPGYQQSEKESVWMCVADVVDGYAEWVSCVVWKQQHDSGMYNAIQTNAIAHEPVQSNPSNEPSNIPTAEDKLW
jgi:hypothetical protein